MMRRGARTRLLGADLDPLSGVANLFDVGVVFALGLVVALAGSSHTETSSSMDRRSGDPTPAERRESLVDFDVGARRAGGEGQRLGTAYRLADGRVIYVPDDSLPRPMSRPNGGESPRHLDFNSQQSSKGNR